MGVAKLKSNSEMDLIDGITYDKHYRMTYHPDFHLNHGIKFSNEDLEYLCMFYGIDKNRTLAFGLGRTESVIRSKYEYLKKKGLIDYYRNRYLRKYEAFDLAETLVPGVVRR